MKGYTKSKYTGELLTSSPLKLIGAKSKTRDYLYMFFPEHNSYSEVFMGSATVLIGRPGFKVIERAVDVNAYAINFFKVLQKYPKEFWNTYYTALTQLLKDELNGQDKASFNSYKYSVTRTDCPILRAVYFYIITKCCVNGIWRLNKKGECNSSYCGQIHARGWLTREWYDRVIDRIDWVSFKCQDYKEVLSRLSNENAFVYLDPPYEYRSKRLPKGTVTTYNGVKFMEKDFREMQALLTQAPYKWLMTVSDTPLMRELFKANYIVPWNVNYSCSQTPAGRGMKPELLIANYDIVSIAKGIKLTSQHAKEETQNSSEESTC